ncbi:Glycerophosphoryl diester phosphodiesterase family [Synechococcus sp. PCC 7335]|uniref:esterase-like activity of phytase family protein n=1 Tax=Synechococcus sp. (strain ATCC 29403 / PCC 7335) TaxID=91464 RepID=UPI00017EDD3E|nr:esterase-like activity of phytase family protein [Synechococcus sp. PCC 7335]EDX87604.1 Glycerophosphoryl diester phosphodiesterase family [Synechococcus sp. PCC 7335]
MANLAQANSAASVAELEGFASLPADTFAEGPPTGEGISANGRTGPFLGPPVQGFSGVQFAPGSDGSTYWFLSDNGFGSKTNSADYLQRLYQVDPNFAGSEEGDGTVDVQSFVQLSDPNGLIPFDIEQGDTAKRNLTGADFDIESFVIDANGEIWIGEEFGPYVLHFDAEGKLLEAPIPTPNITSFNTLDGQAPIVIGHRGASSELPEHTLEAYQLAMAQGADFVEPDLVTTSDGVLIARHEPVLDDTTNVAEVFGEDRMSTKTLDGVELTAYFAEDFTLEEIKQLRAVQSLDFRDPAFDGQFEIPTFQEVIELVQQFEADTGKRVGIYPETKHPTFFDLQGLSLEEPLVGTLQEAGFTDPNRIFIQSFEFQNLIELQGMLDAEGLGALPLVQLYGNTQADAPVEDGFSAPFDIRYNIAEGNDLEAIYGQDFLDAVENELSESTVYSDLDDADFLKLISEKYAEGAGPWKNNFVLREALDTPVDGNGDGVAEITTQLTGEIGSFVDDAHAAGLQVHPYTLRNEERFLTLNADGTPQTPEQEFVQLTQIGVDGFFTDFPETGADIVAQLTADLVYSPDHPDVLVGDVESNLPRSRGYEGMAFSPDRTTLYPMLEGTVLGDPDSSVRIYEFDVESSTFEGLVGLYQMEAPSHAIGDFTPINATEFLVIERDGEQGDDAEFKQIFKVNLSALDEDGFVQKEAVVDLLNIADPNDLNDDGQTTFDFPFVTIEDVLVLDEDTILVANDNNYPFSIGRDRNGEIIDNNEIIQIKLDQPLVLDARLGVDGLGQFVATGQTIVGTVGNDTLAGDRLDDQLTGSLGDDVIRGEVGDDQIFGDFDDSSTANGGGNDAIFAGGGADEVVGGAGDDILYGNPGMDIVLGGDGDDLLSGGLGDDLLDGGLGSDRIYGNAGRDMLVGGDGDDLLVGGKSIDTLFGGAGNDIFAVETGRAADVIMDFSSEDSIALIGSLTFGQLSFTTKGHDVLISVGNDELARVMNTSISDFTDPTFVSLIIV